MRPIRHVVLLIISLNCMLSLQAASILPIDLQCEYLCNPQGIDTPRPRLSWRLAPTDSIGKGQKQTGWHIIVASSTQLLDRNTGDIWDSGLVKSSQSIHIVYGGNPLISGRRYYWKVRTADESDQWSSWSEAATWQTGLLSADDWKACWIGSPQAVGRSVLPQPEDNTQPDPWFRKSFDLDRFPEQAVIYVASIGYHELYINGKRVSDAVLMPSVADHSKRARYITYDITSYLATGKNVIALWLGVSWSIYPSYQTEDKPASPIVLAQADIEFPDGEYRQIITDDTWKTHASPNRLIGYWDAHHFGGEYYDAMQELPGWNEAGFDDSTWERATVFAPRLSVSAEMCESNILYQELIPQSIEEIEPGIYRVDMGVNYAGWFQLQLEGNPGDEIKFEFSEWEDKNDSYGIHSIYLIGRQGKGTFCNRFNYMTGRWIRITGLTAKPSVSDIKAWMIRPGYRRAGFFECDIPAFNEIYNTTLWTFENLSLGNYVVDCPHRERRGYGGDALATTRTALGNYGMGAFYTKWMEDWRDVQLPDGDIPYTAPTYQGGGGPSWSGFSVVLPWEMYQQYGDKQLLEISFPTVERWLAFMETKSKDNMLVRWGGKWSFLGDWIWPNAWDERSRMEKQGLALGDTQETLFFNNCVWIHNLELAARIADVIGNGRGECFRSRAGEIRRAVHNKFFNPEDNSYVNGYQAYMAMALASDIPPVELRTKVWERLEYEIKVKRDGHFWGGITAGAYLFHFLLDTGRNDLINLMVSQEDYPGWINMIRKGPGTFFEDWRCSGSALHSSYLYVGSWFIEGLAGIQRPVSGSSHFVIHPWINPDGPAEVKAHYNSIYGPIASHWKRYGNRIEMQVTLPPNTTATVKIIDTDLELVSGNHNFRMFLDKDNEKGYEYGNNGH